MSKQKRRLPQTAKADDRETLGKFTVKCPKCHNPGLFIYYDYGTHEVRFSCGWRQLPDGTDIWGCNETVYHFPITKRQYHGMIAHPMIQENFFFMQVLDDETL